MWNSCPATTGYDDLTTSLVCRCTLHHNSLPCGMAHAAPGVSMASCYHGHLCYHLHCFLSSHLQYTLTAHLQECPSSGCQSALANLAFDQVAPRCYSQSQEDQLIQLPSLACAITCVLIVYSHLCNHDKPSRCSPE